MISQPISSILSFPGRSGSHGVLDYIAPDQVWDVALSLSPFPDIGFVQRVYRWVRDHITYTTDPDQFGSAEVFLFPRETVLFGKGDCEDLSNLIVSLLLSAFPPEDVRVVYGVQIVRDPVTGEVLGTYNHAWTEVYVDGRWVYVDGTFEYPLSVSSSRSSDLFPEFYIYPRGVSA